MTDTETAVPAPVPVALGDGAATARRGMWAYVLQRMLAGALTIWVVSVVVFGATQLLPGNAARAVLGNRATPEALASMEKQMGLDKPAVEQYLDWAGGLLHGDLGTSLVNGSPASQVVGPMVVNSLVLVVIAGVLGTVLGVVLGLAAAVRRGKIFDHVSSAVALTATSVPEFVVAAFVIAIFSTGVVHWFPAVSIIAPGARPWDSPELLVLPSIVLIIAVVPYIFRMVRAATIEALQSEYAEMAQLKGVRSAGVLVRHALPNALAPSIQAIALNLLYLAGGIVVVEVVFNYPGIGQGLYNAVSQKDIPIIQSLTVFLATFYILVNIAADVLTLAVTPRRRLAR